MNKSSRPLPYLLDLPSKSIPDSQHHYPPVNEYTNPKLPRIAWVGKTSSLRPLSTHAKNLLAENFATSFHLFPAT